MNKSWPGPIYIRKNILKALGFSKAQHAVGAFDLLKDQYN